jgi:plasmid stability protein
MNLVIRDLPAGVWENLKKKANASGRTVEAEAAALLSDSLQYDGDAEDMDDLQRMVYDMYGGNVPKGEVDALIADRRLESKREAEKLG